jgi:hypothetical protein
VSAPPSPIDRRRHIRRHQHPQSFPGAALTIRASRDRLHTLTFLPCQRRPPSTLVWRAVRRHYMRPGSRISRTVSSLTPMLAMARACEAHTCLNTTFSSLFPSCTLSTPLCQPRTTITCYNHLLRVPYLSASSERVTPLMPHSHHDHLPLILFYSDENTPLALPLFLILSIYLTTVHGYPTHPSCSTAFSGNGGSISFQ